MSPATTLEQVQAKHDKAVEVNRDLNVVQYKSGEKQSERVYEVTDGVKYLPGGKGKRLGPGQRFHPTERQVRDGSLRGKARELSATELRGLGKPSRASGKTAVEGSDIGVRALPISSKLATYALENGLTEEDFAGVEPAGESGKFTRGQVDELIAAKSAATND